jgi:6-pyruvoyltetrahydropterin/6-carboxytetrahydropterin synthase
MDRFRVRVGGESVPFSSAHFLVLGEGDCEHLHGHNYRVGVELDGPLDERRYVYDFIALKAMLRSIVDAIDHRTILPTRSPALAVEDRGPAVRARLAGKEWILPREDCALLPIANSTAEEIAAWIAGRLREEMARAGLPPPTRMVVEVAEDAGQSAAVES